MEISGKTAVCRGGYGRIGEIPHRRNAENAIAYSVALFDVADHIRDKMQ